MFPQLTVLVVAAIGAAILINVRGASTNTRLDPVNHSEPLLVEARYRIELVDPAPNDPYLAITTRYTTSTGPSELITHDVPMTFYSGTVEIPAGSGWRASLLSGPTTDPGRNDFDGPEFAVSIAFRRSGESDYRVVAHNSSRAITTIDASVGNFPSWADE